MLMPLYRGLRRKTFSVGLLIRMLMLTFRNLDRGGRGQGCLHYFLSIVFETAFPASSLSWI